MLDALRRHWFEYLAEAAGLGLFMVSATVFTAIFEHEGAALRGLVPDPDVRRTLIGLAMGMTAVGLIYSPWGRRSGAHMNPAVTWTFWRLGRIDTRDAVFYTLAQALGGLAGVVLAAAALAPLYGTGTAALVVTVPGPFGVGAAFAAEFVLSCGLMLAVLKASADARVAPYTGVIAGALVALYIAVEAPLSGMSINPARSFASALPAGNWTSFWIYLAAPPLGMLAAAEIHVLTCRFARRGAASLCGEGGLHHV